MESDGLNAQSLDQRAAKAAEDPKELELLIEEFQPFLHGCVARYALRSESQHEELFGTAMLAFYEAINSYKTDKGHFFPFSRSVVTRRLIDEVRKDYRKNPATVSIDAADEDGMQPQAVSLLSAQEYGAQMRQQDIRDEIEQFKLELSQWDITMKSLAAQSPKHDKLRQTYRMVIQVILDNVDIIQIIQLKRYFPVKKIAELTGVPPKKIERARTFIIASLIIQNGDYEYLSDYIEKR